MDRFFGYRLLEEPVPVRRTVASQFVKPADTLIESNMFLNLEPQTIHITRLQLLFSSFACWALFPQNRHKYFRKWKLGIIFFTRSHFFINSSFCIASELVKNGFFYMLFIITSKVTFKALCKHTDVTSLEEEDLRFQLGVPQDPRKLKNT